jgi:methyl-accepting chemotaxis protein
MNFVRQLAPRTKVFACFAVLLSLGALPAGYLLVALAAVTGPGTGAAAIALMQGELAATRGWALAWLVLELGCGAMLARWLAAEFARPVQAAAALAQRIAAGDLSARFELQAGGEAGQLLHSMRQMNETLVTMVVEVRGGTEAISSGAGAIAGGSIELSERTGQQAVSLEQTATSMEQLTATVKQNADHAHQASKLAVSASEVAVKGGAVVSEVVGTMASINDSSKRIAEIIGVIDGIAFQTNILALNAAVEAARAGEQGRGFAVVASEVRNLAQRSAAAAKEIKVLIDDSVEKVTAGTLLVDRAGHTMNEVVTSVKRVTDIIAEIADASAEQTTGIEQVNRAIAAMDQATQQNAALVGQTASAAEAMRDQAGSLSRAVGAFVLAPGSARAAPPARFAPSAPGRPSATAGDARPRAKAAPARPAKVRAAPPAPVAPAAAATPRPAAASAAPRAAAPPPALKRTGTQKHDIDDWEEF